MSDVARTRRPRPRSGPVAVDILWSYARPLGEDVRLVLVLPSDTPVAADRLWLRLESEADAFRVPATATAVDEGLRVEAAVPAGQLRPALWKLKLRVGKGGRLLVLQARLLVADGQPLALLPGPRPSLRKPQSSGATPY